MVGPDQTCGVPGRTISENLCHIRDLIEYAEHEDIPLALLSLDQETAFDRVEWVFCCVSLTFLISVQTFAVGSSYFTRTSNRLWS